MNTLVSRFEETKKYSEKSSYIRSSLATPVRMVREQVQAVWAQTDSVKTTVQDQYTDFQDRTDCKLSFTLCDSIGLGSDELGTYFICLK